MPRQKGQGRTPGSGRKKGTPNKKPPESNVILARIQKRYPKWHPVEALAKMANDATLDNVIRLHATKEVAQYCVPKLKAVEISGPGGAAIPITIAKEDETL